MAAKTDLHLKLYRESRNDEGYTWSPFVIKLEFRLRVAGVKYSTALGSTSSGPKGKIPYIDLQTEGQNHCIGDSALIIKALSDLNIIPDVNSAITPATRAHDLALRALLEEKLYFYHSRERWIDNYYTMRDHILSALPYPMRVLVGLSIYRATSQGLHKQGTGRYSADEIQLFKQEIWESVNDLLLEARKGTISPDEPYWVLGGRESTEADATLFGFIVSVLMCTAGPESQKIVRSYPAVVNYAERIHAKYFPDYRKWA